MSKNNKEFSDIMLNIAAIKLFNKDFDKCDMFQKNTCTKQVMAFLEKSFEKPKKKNKTEKMSGVEFLRMLSKRD